MPVIYILLLAFVGFTAAMPHTGMVDNDKIRDASVFYTRTNFKGKSKFIFEAKDSPESLPIDDNVVSIKICKKDAACVFYTGTSCTPGEDNYAVSIGCGDVAELKTPKGNYFRRYLCGKAKDVHTSNYVVKTVVHEEDEGGASVMIA